MKQVAFAALVGLLALGGCAGSVQDAPSGQGLPTCDPTLVAGCGTNVGPSNVAAGVTIAEARATCLEYAMIADLDAVDVETAILLAEAFRNDGGSQSEYLSDFLPTCESELDPDPGVCLACIAQVAAVVWN